MTEPNAALEAALAYAKNGFAVFPLRHLTKLPACPNGFYDATTSPAVIKAWWGSNPDYGIAMRIPESMVVVDLDTIGADTLKKHNKEIIDTAKVKSRRGYHYYYYLPRGFQKDKAKRKVGYLPDVDILINGYTLVPPTAHPVTKKKYEWEVDLREENIEVAPDWVWLALEEEQKSDEWRHDEQFIDGIPEGHRNEYIFKRVCRMCRLGNSKGETLAVAVDLAKRSGLDDDVKRMVDNVWGTYRASDERKRLDEENAEEKVWALSALLTEVTEPPDYLVDKVLPGIGYSILFGSQGAGKSVLADQIAVSVATGSRIFNREVRRAGAVVLDIEQDPAGGADRWRKLLRGLAVEQVPANLYTAFEWPPIDEGGLDKLAAFLVDHPHVQLVVVDSLYNLAPASVGEGYFSDGRSMAKFTRFAKEYGIAFLINHHSRKPQNKGPDNFSDLASGTRGITGPAKARLGLTREEFGVSGELRVGGKVPESKISLTFDKDFLVWR